MIHSGDAECSATKISKPCYGIVHVQYFIDGVHCTTPLGTHHLQHSPPQMKLIFKSGDVLMFCGGPGTTERYSRRLSNRELQIARDEIQKIDFFDKKTAPAVKNTFWYHQALLFKLLLFSYPSSIKNHAKTVSPSCFPNSSYRFFVAS